MSYATIDELRSQLGGAPKHSPEYLARMMHPLPSGACVDRAKFILDRVTGKRVLEFGASGAMHEQVKAAAAKYLGVDRDDSANLVVACDLDDVSTVGFPEVDGNICFEPEIIVCGEVLEHLGNPQWFLARLKEQYSGVPVLITVPNAFASAGRGHLAKGFENVNVDHVAWYSPRTLKTLVERVGYVIKEFAYYNGDGPTAEGLIAVVE